MGLLFFWGVWSGVFVAKRKHMLVILKKSQNIH
jgi:hypothetical protein